MLACLLRGEGGLSKERFKEFEVGRHPTLLRGNGGNEIARKLHLLDVDVVDHYKRKYERERHRDRHADTRRGPARFKEGDRARYLAVHQRQDRKEIDIGVQIVEYEKVVEGVARKRAGKRDTLGARELGRAPERHDRRGKERYIEEEGGEASGHQPVEEGVVRPIKPRLLPIERGIVVLIKDVVKALLAPAEYWALGKALPRHAPDSEARLAILK